MSAMLKQRCRLGSRRHEAITGHTVNSIRRHRHFLKGGRWRLLPATNCGEPTPSFQ
jgi:hypothetical protein